MAKCLGMVCTAAGLLEVRFFRKKRVPRKRHGLQGAKLHGNDVGFDTNHTQQSPGSSFGRVSRAFRASYFNRSCVLYFNHFVVAERRYACSMRVAAAGKKCERSRRTLKRSGRLRHKLVDRLRGDGSGFQPTNMPGLECTHVEMPFEGAARGASKKRHRCTQITPGFWGAPTPGVSNHDSGSLGGGDIGFVPSFCHTPRTRHHLNVGHVTMCWPSVPTPVRCVPQAKCFLRSYSGQSVKTLSALCVTNLDTGRMSEGVHVATVFWREIPSDVVDRVVARGLVMSSVSRERLDLICRCKIRCKDLCFHDEYFGDLQ